MRSLFGAMTKNREAQLRQMLSAEQREEYDGMAISAMFGTMTVANEKRMAELEELADSRLLANQAASGIGTSSKDRVVVWLTNFVLRFATNDYRMFVKGAIEYGIRSAARDVSEGREPPGDWRKEPND